METIPGFHEEAATLGDKLAAPTARLADFATDRASPSSLAAGLGPGLIGADRLLLPGLHTAHTTVISTHAVC